MTMPEYQDSFIAGWRNYMIEITGKVRAAMDRALGDMELAEGGAEATKSSVC